MSAGVPSHDTFGRVFSMPSPVAFQEAFIGWARTLHTGLDGRIVAIDGKTSRRSHDRSRKLNRIALIGSHLT